MTRLFDLVGDRFSRSQLTRRVNVTSVQILSRRVIFKLTHNRFAKNAIRHRKIDIPVNGKNAILRVTRVPSVREFGIATFDIANWARRVQNPCRIALRVSYFTWPLLWSGEMTKFRARKELSRDTNR